MKKNLDDSSHTNYIAPMKIKSTKDIVDQISKIREAANLLIEKELHYRGIEGVVPAHGMVFSFLFKQKDLVPIMSVVQNSGRAKSTVTEMVKTLERYGYIYRQSSPDDGRSFHIGLTDKGWSIRSDFEEISEILIRKVYGDMAGKEREKLVQLLSQIEDNLA